MSSAVLVIDVQEALFRPEPRPGRADAVVANINALTARARAQSIPVIYIQHEEAGGPLTHDGPGWALDRGLDVHAGDRRVRKTTPDSFLRTDLEALLREMAVSHLVVCGYASECCIDTTVRRAAALGFDVTLAEDAHTTHDAQHASAAQMSAHHNAVLVSLTSFGTRLRAQPAHALSFA